VSFKRVLLSLGFTIPLCLFSISAQAEQLVLQVYPSSDAPSAGCPKQVSVTENSKPHEGGFTVNGRAELNSLAGSFSIATRDAFSVTWVAKLKPQYSRCKATAGLSDNHSYLRLKLIDGRVFLILDMTGVRDANGFTSTILSQGVRNGNPVWQWGGTD
jgi:hypothetical protein